MDTVGTLKLHINEKHLEITDFKKSLDAFTDMIQALLEDAAPTAKWFLSVDKGSMVLNADLVIERLNTNSKVQFKAIQKNIADLSTGKDLTSCPKKARQAYKNFTHIVGSTNRDKPLAEILTHSTFDTTEVALPIIAMTKKSPNVPFFYATGTLTGKICSLSTKNKTKQLRLIDESSGKKILGIFSDEMLSDARKSFDRRAMVSGTIKYRSNGSILSIQIADIHILPDNVPQLSELYGVLEA